MDISALGPRSGHVVARVLEDHPNFRVVSLTGNALGDEGASLFSEVLMVHRGLISLDLSSNGIGDIGAACVFKAMRQNKTLTHLRIGSATNVFRNSLGARAAGELFEMLQDNCVLSSLDLAMAEIGLCSPMIRGITRLLMYRDVRVAFCEGRGFIRTMESLFSRGLIEKLLDTDLSEFEELFGHDTSHGVGQEALDKADILFRVYHDALAELLCAVLLRDTKDRAFEFIRHVMRKTHFTGDRGSGKIGAWQLAYNMEAVMSQACLRYPHLITKVPASCCFMAQEGSGHLTIMEGVSQCMYICMTLIRFSQQPLI